ncbi:MAG TPA: hypothetical protein VJN72_07220 [Gaiellales bacterium]|nr:hypothetical protein [Gaiellales bacterium]
MAAVRFRADDDKLGPFFAGDPANVLRGVELAGADDPVLDHLAAVAVKDDHGLADLDDAVAPGGAGARTPPASRSPPG